MKKKSDKNHQFSFDPDDFLEGVSGFSFEEIGKYAFLLCKQAIKGNFTKEEMEAYVGSVSSKLALKYKEDEEGKLYNERLYKEVTIKKMYRFTRSENGKKGGRGNVSEEKAYAKHMLSGDILYNNNISLNTNNNINNISAKSICFPYAFDAKIFKCLGSLQEKGKINLELLESCYFDGKGIEHVKGVFVSYFRDKGYKFQNEQATLTCFRGFENILKQDQISEELETKAPTMLKVTDDAKDRFGQFYAKFGPHDVFWVHVRKHSEKEKRSLTEQLLIKYSVLELAKMIFRYYFLEGGSDKGTYSHFLGNWERANFDEESFNSYLKNLNITL